LVAILADATVGGTFLTWSLHYLAGHKKYYHVASKQWLDVSSDPVTNKNAHGFDPNQPVSLDKFNLIHSTLTDTPTDTFHTIYFHNFNQIHAPTYDNDNSEAVSKLDDTPLVVLALAKEHNLYYCSYHRRAVTYSHHTSEKITQDQEALDDYISYFFKDSLDAWKELRLTEIWDQREFLALNMNLTNKFSIIPHIDLSRDHYALDTMELWNTFDSTVDNLFAYLKINIDEDRRSHWNTVYNKWQKLHHKQMLFVWYFNKIIDYIINGYELDLTRFDLDILQESAIQQELIYKHNLNLKTWQLEKFTNTKQLHQLLEPNIHDLSKSKILKTATQ
jgi:hypothetical protein